jgi:transposase InsO family protein
LDIFSRYAVAWIDASRKSAILAQRMFAETIRKQHIGRGQLSIRADLGSAISSKPVAFLLADLGVTRRVLGQRVHPPVAPAHARHGGRSFRDRISRVRL